MKKFVLSILCVAGLSLAVQAQTSYRVTPTPTAVPFAWTNLAQAATNVGWVIDCRGSQFVSLFLSSTNDAAATDNIGYVFYRSLDGTTATKESAAVANILLAATGTTAINTITNIPTYGCGYLILGYTTNAAATANAVIRMRYSLKTGI